jgi:uncharacterized protein (DUF2062 family)
VIVPLFRSPHSAEHTARGVANGVFWGLTPTIGLQTLGIMATWLIARKLLRKDSSLLQAFIWVWVNNPLTVVPMYYAFYVTGLWLTGQGEQAAGYSAFGALLTAGDAGWLTRVTTLMAALGLPLLLGCLPYAIVGATVSYAWARAVVRRREERRSRRRLAVMADETL